MDKCEGWKSAGQGKKMSRRSKERDEVICCPLVISFHVLSVAGVTVGKKYGKLAPSSSISV
jgi:hypothetical protein